MHIAATTCMCTLASQRGAALGANHIELIVPDQESKSRLGSVAPDQRGVDVNTS